MLELVAFVMALKNTTLYTDLECIYARCTQCGYNYPEHLCEIRSLLDLTDTLMTHQETH